MATGSVYRGELTASDETDHEGAEAKTLMDMQRQHRQRDANDKKGDQDDAHDRQHSGHGSALSTGRPHPAMVAGLGGDRRAHARAIALSEIVRFAGAGGMSIV